MGNYVCEMYDWQRVSDINTKITFTYKWEKEPNMNTDTLHQKRNIDTNGQWIYEKKSLYSLILKKYKEWAQFWRRRWRSNCEISHTPGRKWKVSIQARLLRYAVYCACVCVCVCLCVCMCVYMHTCTYKIFEQSQEDNFKQKYTFIDILTSLNT